MSEKPHLELFKIFFKIGLTAFGGGYTIFALLEREISSKRGWLTKDEMFEVMALSQSVPGVMYVNASTIVGYKMGGVLGAFIATLAGVLPTLILTLIVVMFLWEYTKSPYLTKAITGILIGIAALILQSSFKLA